MADEEKLDQKDQEIKHLKEKIIKLEDMNVDTEKRLTVEIHELQDALQSETELRQRLFDKLQIIKLLLDI